MKIKHKLKTLIILFVPVTVLMKILLRNYPEFFEKHYSNTINRIIRQVLSLGTGFLPFSVAEFLIITLVIILLISIIVLIFKIRRGGFLEQLLNILTYLSSLYILFMILWGFNYNRVPIHVIANLEIREASKEELYNLCESLIDRANISREKVQENSQGITMIEGGYRNVFYSAHKGYDKASLIYPELGGKYGSPKPLVLSKAMSYAGITGIYMPYTGEANVNINIPHFSLPYVAAHEMAHQRGFAREDEANYIAYLTTTMHEDVNFQCSGVVHALITSMNAMANADTEAYRVLVKKYSDGLRRDLQYSNEFWAEYDGKIDKAANSVNNSYLKSNGESDGVSSYGRMIDLLLAEYRKSPRFP